MWNMHINKIVQKRSRCFALKMLAEWKVKAEKLYWTHAKLLVTCVTQQRAKIIAEWERQREEECSPMSVGEYFIWLSTLGSVAFWKNTQAKGIKVHPELAYSNVTLNYQQIRSRPEPKTVCSYILVSVTPREKWMCTHLTKGIGVIAQ